MIRVQRHQGHCYEFQRPRKLEWQVLRPVAQLGDMSPTLGKFEQDIYLDSQRCCASGTCDSHGVQRRRRMRACDNLQTECYYMRKYAYCSPLLSGLSNPLALSLLVLSSTLHLGGVVRLPGSFTLHFTTTSVLSDETKTSVPLALIFSFPRSSHSTRSQPSCKDAPGSA